MRVAGVAECREMWRSSHSAEVRGGFYGRLGEVRGISRAKQMKQYDEGLYAYWKEILTQPLHVQAIRQVRTLQDAEAD
jgi:hypothetical protein